jgi:uncharacterized integral membrane protein (TIGR00697 family)
MDDKFTLPLIQILQSTSGELVSVAFFLICIVSVMLMLRFFGDYGLYAYSSVASIIANIQVLKLGKFYSIDEPVALGTVTFASVYLANDIITEHFGKSAAQKSVWLATMLQVITMVMMLLVIGITPVKGDLGHEAIAYLFMPAPRLLLASLIASVASQMYEISLFSWISRLNNKKRLWIRSAVSLLVSGFIDNVVYSVFAWFILSPSPVSSNTLIYTYILGTYTARIIMALCSIPAIYLSYSYLPKK